MMKKTISNSKIPFLLILGVLLGFSGFALAFPGDIDGDGYANELDLSLLIDQWLENDCASFAWCDGADINHNGIVDFSDFTYLAQKWSTAMPIWSDEFEGVGIDPNKVDPAKWTTFTEADKAPNGTIDSWYRSENVAVSGGTLQISNKEELYNGVHWTGGHVDALYYPQYKYLVARVKHSAPDIYIWATWWTVGWAGQWPPEMDICETQGGPGASPGQAYHWNYGEDLPSNSDPYDAKGTGMDESQWHTYGTYWTADNAACLYYVDGVMTYAPVGAAENNLIAAKLKFTSSPNSYTRVHNCPLGMMLVDYVRVYDAPPAQPFTQHLALNKPVTVSSAKNSGGAGQRAVDEYDKTRWESNWYDPQWVVVDLQATCSVTQVKIHWQYACASNYKIQVASSPSGPWTDCISITGRSASESWATHNFAAQTGRYIRLYCSARATAWGNSLYDMQVYGTVIDPNPSDPPARTNLALGKTATSSSNESGSLTANKAVDGSMATRWASVIKVDPQWIYVDLGATYTIDTVKLYWEAAAGKDYKIQTADSSSGPWTDRATVTNGSYGLKIHEFTPVSCRYVRMYGTARKLSLYGYSLYEMQVY